MISLTHLRADLLVEPRGIGNPLPTFTWEIRDSDAGAWRQNAWRIIVSETPEDADSGRGTLWDSGRVVDSDTALIKYAGSPLTSRMRCWWRVTCWGSEGDETSSGVASFTMGLLDADEWAGYWIGLDSAPETPADPLVGARWIWTEAAPEPGEVVFEKRFTLDDSVAGELWGLADDEGEVAINGVPLCQLARAQGNTDLYPLPLAVPVPKLPAGENVIRVKAKKRHARDPEAGLIVRLLLGGREVIDSGKGQETALFTTKHRRIEGGVEVVTDGTWRTIKDEGESAVRELGSYGIAPWHMVTAMEYPNLSARYLRRDFSARESVERAVLYLSGQGLAEAWINGEKVSDEVLSPHLSDPNVRVHYRTHDVSGLLKEGSNAIGCILGNGRYFAPRKRVPFPMESYGCPKLLLQLEITYADGKTEWVVSDPDWRLSTEGAVGWNNEFDGEHYDARRDDPAWCAPGFDDATWCKPQIVAAPFGQLAAQVCAPIKRHETVPVRESWTTKYGTTIYDFGENVVGWCRATFRGKSGTRLVLRHAETLESRDSLSVENLRSAQATDFVTLGDGETRFEPKFVFHGFRYAELRGAVESAELEAVYVHDDVPATGTFHCSSDLVNRIVEASARGIRTNCRSMPTDCPQRDERMGWLGDRAGGAPSEMFLFDLANFYRKWLDDIRDAQAPNGCIPDVAPAFWRMYNDNVTWPSVVAFIPHWLHRHYGDDGVVAENFDAIARWLDHMSRYLVDGLIDRDLYGDWCVPPEEPHLIFTLQDDRKTHAVILASTYLARDFEIAAEFADRLGRDDYGKKWRARRAAIITALNARFYDDASGTYDNGAQTASVLPLAFGLVPDGRERKTFDALVKKMTASGCAELGTGLVGTRSLLRTLTAYGRPDLARDLATREAYPGWGYMIRQGATTIWELWNGDTASPFMNSGNHVMLTGDLIAWLFEDVAGIQPAEPGFRRVRFRPHFVFETVNCRHQSIRGEIDSRWVMADGRIEWTVTLPPNVAGWAELPVEMAADLTLDGVRPEKAVAPSGCTENDWVRFDLEPGRHRIVLTPGPDTQDHGTSPHIA